MTFSSALTFQANRRRLSRSTALTAAIFMLPVSAMALPTGDNVVGGTATVIQGGNTTTINQSSEKAAINWNQFNVSNGETVRFNQPGTSSITLNRVVADANPSQILGNIEANGRVIISNPNGMVFGSNSRTDVAGLIATTADITPTQFMNNDTLRFSRAGATNAQIEVKDGARITSTAREQGLVALVAPQVINNGLIVANQGKVVLAGAEKATIDLTGDGLVSFTVSNQNSNTLVRHGGTITAQGGQVMMTARAASDVVNRVVNTNGVPDADALVATPNGLVLVEGGVDVSSAAAGKIELRGQDIIARNGASLRANGNPAGTINAIAERHAIVGGGKGEVAISANSTGNGQGKGGNIKILAKSGAAVLNETATLSATGYDGGKIEFSGADILLAGGFNAGSAGGKSGSLILDPATIIINNGGANGLLNNIAEQWIEAQSQGGTNVTIEATDLIRMENLVDSVLLGGAGDITLRTLGAAGEIRFTSNGDMIRTTTGDVNLIAGSGGITIGSIATGINGAYPAYDAPIGEVLAGTIRLTTTGGGNIVARNLSARGTRNTSSILVDASGNFLARSLNVRVDDQPAPGSADTARIDVLAGGDLTVTESVIARAQDDQGATRNARAIISLVSASGDVEVGSALFANADGGVRNAGDAGESVASIVVRGDNINLQRAEANADGGNNATATVDITATGRLTQNFDLLALAKKSAIGVGTALGNITVSASEMIVPITDTLTAVQATSNVLITAPITVRTPEDAIVLGGTPVPTLSDRILRLQGGNSVTVNGDIETFLASVVAIAGAGGISLDNVSTGDPALVAADVLNQIDGAFQAGDITLTTTNNGNISTGNLSAAGTFGTTRFKVTSDGDFTSGGITLIGEDGPDRGSVDLMAISIDADDAILINGNILLRGEDRQGATQRAEVTLDMAAGTDLTVTGDVNVLAQGGLRGTRVTDTGSSYATAFLSAGDDLTLNDVTVEALGGTEAYTYLYMGAPNGGVTLGSTLSRAVTTAISGAGNAIVGVADATLEIVALGTSIDSGVNITYNGANPLAVADGASRQGRFTDSQTLGGDTARLIIINAPIDPVDPVDPTPPVPPVTPPTPVAPLAAPFFLEEIELNRTSDFAQNLYSFFGETLGDQYYFGNTDVNLSLLGGGNPQVNFSNDPAALAGLSPAAGGGDATEQTRRRPRLTGGSEGKRARYAWAATGGTAPVEGAGRGLAVAQAPAPSSAGSPESLAGLSPAAGGDAAQNLNAIAPAAGASGNCGNNYLDAGYAAGFDNGSCSEGLAFNQ